MPNDYLDIIGDRTVTSDFMTSAELVRTEIKFDPVTFEQYKEFLPPEDVKVSHWPEFGVEIDYTLGSRSEIRDNFIIYRDMSRGPIKAGGAIGIEGTANDVAPQDSDYLIFNDKYYRIIDVKDWDGVFEQLECRVEEVLLGNS